MFYFAPFNGPIEGRTAPLTAHTRPRDREDLLPQIQVRADPGADIYESVWRPPDWVMLQEGRKATGSEPTIIEVSPKGDSVKIDLTDEDAGIDKMLARDSIGEIDPPDHVAMATEPYTKPIDTTPVTNL
jgi:hypothetical protein